MWSILLWAFSMPRQSSEPNFQFQLQSTLVCCQFFELLLPFACRFRDIHNYWPGKLWGRNGLTAVVFIVISSWSAMSIHISSLRRGSPLQ
jgi:hypothetical protein